MRTIIIGGGLQGLCTAKVLSDQAESVEVLEAREGVALETSFANGGLLTASLPTPWNSPGVFKHLMASLFDPLSPMKLHLKTIPSLATWGLKFLSNSTRDRYQKATVANYKLASYSIAKTTELSQKLALGFDARCNGTLAIYRDKQSLQEVLQLLECMAGLGLEYSLLDASGAVDVEPHLSDIENQIHGALHFPDDITGDAHLFCRALEHDLKTAGINIRTDTVVEELIIQNNQVRGVKIDGEELHADRVVVAMGTRSPFLLRGTGVALPIKPAKGYSVTFDLDPDLDRPNIPIIDDSLHAAITPLGNRLRAVGTAEFCGYDTVVEERRAQNLVKLLKVVYPSLVESIDMSKGVAWAGLRPMSCDGKPFIGPSKIKGLYINAGHGQLGWTMAMGSAHLLADLLAERTPAIDGTPFAIHR